MADPLASLRAKHLDESLQKSNEPGWGYFGVAGPLCIGDNSYTANTTRKIPDERDGETIRNIQAAPLKKGAGVDVYFTFEPPLCIGDEYKDPIVMTKRGKVHYVDPDNAFKPPGKIKESTNKLGYDYIEHCDGVKDPMAVREKYRDYTPLRQIQTNPVKKGGGGVYTPGVLFGMDEERKFPECISGDDYDAAKKLRAKELEEHKKLLQEAPFRGMEYGNRAFHKDTDVYEYTEPTHIPRPPKESNLKVLQHEAPFCPANPSKKGILRGLIGGIPEYVEDPPPRGAERKPKGDDERAPYRLGNARSVCNPTPSVTTMTRNMRNERPSSFARPTL